MQLNEVQSIYWSYKSDNTKPYQSSAASSSLNMSERSLLWKTVTLEGDDYEGQQNAQQVMNNNIAK
jgi:hypothetical protein